MPDLLSEKREHVTVLTLNRPERLNTISHPMLVALAAALLEAGRDGEVRDDPGGDRGGEGEAGAPVGA